MVDSGPALNSVIFFRIPSNCAVSKRSIPFWKKYLKNRVKKWYRT